VIGPDEVVVTVGDLGQKFTLPRLGLAGLDETTGEASSFVPNVLRSITRRRQTRRPRTEFERVASTTEMINEKAHDRSCVNSKLSNGFCLIAGICHSAIDAGSPTARLPIARRTLVNAILKSSVRNRFHFVHSTWVGSPVEISYMSRRVLARGIPGPCRLCRSRWISFKLSGEQSRNGNNRVRRYRFSS